MQGEKADNIPDNNTKQFQFTAYEANQK